MAKITQTDIHKKAMIEALEKSLGIVTTACKAVGIARQTHYEWYNEDEAYKASVDAVGDMVIDFVESQLHKQIQQGEVASTIFFLKCRGKKRGYIERTELDLSGAVSFPPPIWNILPPSE